MANQVLEKVVQDNRIFTFDFTAYPEIVNGESITAGVVTCLVTGLTIGAVTLGSGLVNVRLSGGLAGVTYTLKCVATTSGGSTITGCGDLEVVDC